MSFNPVIDGGAAFPTLTTTHKVSGVEVPDQVDGMSIRAYLAGCALTGLMAHPPQNMQPIQEDMRIACCYGAIAVMLADAVMIEMGVVPFHNGHKHEHIP